jgi:hypothetical protein
LRLHAARIGSPCVTRARDSRAAGPSKSGGEVRLALVQEALHALLSVTDAGVAGRAFLGDDAQSAEHETDARVLRSQPYIHGRGDRGAADVRFVEPLVGVCQGRALLLVARPKTFPPVAFS